MNSIYMNNYRGFSRTVVTLRSVNFFVGENSTGKSSVLSLIELLSTPDFWFNLDFNAGNNEFGGFKDIVSAISSDRREFQIGLFKQSDGELDDNVCYLLHFREAKDGAPQLARFSRICMNFHATIRLSEKQISGIVKTTPTLADFSIPADCFKFMQEVTAQHSSGYKILGGEMEHFIRHSPIVNFPLLLHRLLNDKKMREDIPSFHFPGLLTSVASMAPIRTKPKRTYDGYTKLFSSEGEHTPYVIRKELPPQKNRTNAFLKALKAFGKDSGLFQSIGVKQFGNDPSAPFELTITLGEKALRINSVGYGVSQVLPVIVELITHGKKSWIAIQQPEVHLHPKAQAALGGVLFHAAIDESQTLIVETHSDYLLDRFRLSMRDHEHPKGFAQIIFFERSSDGNHVYPMLIDSSGEYPLKQPSGFRSFFLAEHKRILGI